MIHAVAAMLIALGCAVQDGVADDPKPDPPEPPVRLKKKEKPTPVPEQKPTEPKKVKEEGEDKDMPTAEPEQDTKETVGRIAKNMRSSEERLAKKDPGDGTRQIQRDILKDLDGLIDQTRKQQQQQQLQQQSSSSSDSKGQQQRKERSKNDPGKQRAGKPKPNQANQPKESSANNPGRGGKHKDQMDKIADLYKDVWGHLPETLRQEMDQYSREQFMAKYNELLKQYYATIAEKGRRKGD